MPLGRTFGLVRAGVATAAVGALVFGVFAVDRPQVTADLVAVPVVPAFPGAEGFGTQTPGGRGGAVLKVTNLNDSGAGSLRAALEASGPRTVVFRVSGTIVLKSRIDVEDPYLTVAGQTAPGGGITLRVDPAASPCIDKGTMLVATHDVIIRYLRLRPGPTSCADDSHDALTIYKPGTENVVIDHVSMSWAVDEVFNTYDASQNITISNSIIAEGLSNSTHPDGEHSKGALIGGADAHNVSLHGNLFVSNVDRNPQISGLSVADVRNNVIYNYGDGSGSGVTLVSSSKGQPRVNWVGNYYKPGPSSDPSRPEFAVYSGDTGDTWQWYGDANMRWTSSGLVSARVHSGATASRVSSAFAAAPVTTTSAAVAYDQVLAQAGAAVPFRDAVDQRLVQSVVNGTGQLVDDPSQVGGYPTLPSTAPAADDDADGMPNSAETAHGTNPNVPDSNGDIDGNGYTNLEDWFNGLTPAGPTDPDPPSNAAPVVDAGPNRPITLPATAKMAATVTDDGLPAPAGLTHLWATDSGPANAGFSSATAQDPTVTFPVAGTYVLRLTVHDGAMAASDTVQVTVRPASGGGTPQVLERRVSASSDDAEESLSSGSVQLSSSDIELTTDGSTQQVVGLRFGGLQIPPGATITNAYVQFRTDEASTGASSMTIRAVNVDNTPTFTSATRNVSSRATTTANVAWSPPAWPTVGAAGTSQRTPDLAPLVQAVVGRAGWAQGNALAFAFSGTGRRTAEPFEGGASFAPLLHVEYTTGTGGPTNQAPVVNAGADQTITLPATASLDGTITDDGLPASGSLTSTWTRTSGPGTVTFANFAATDTSATFSTAGTYVLRLTAGDGALTTQDEVTVTVNPPTPTNTPPVVNAGADQTITLPATASLDGTITDDGLPASGSLTSTWTRTSGPGTVTFANFAATDTTATFSTAGTYVLRLTAGDGALTTQDEVTVTVNPAGGGGTPRTLEVRVATGSDDAEQSTSSGKNALTSDDLEITTDGNTVQLVGVRFAKVTIPANATITNAYVQFRVDGASTATTSLAIRAENAANTPTYTSGLNNISSRATTSTSVGWAPAAWPTVGAAGEAQRTPNLAALVQAVVGRTGWATGNALAFQFSGTGMRKAVAFEGGVSFAPLLHVEYTVP